MRWLQNAGAFVLAIVLTLAFASTPGSATDIIDTISVNTHVVEFVPNLPAPDFVDVKTMTANTIDAAAHAVEFMPDLPALDSIDVTMTAIMIGARTALAGSSRVTHRYAEDFPMLVSVYHRPVGYQLRQ